MMSQEKVKGELRETYLRCLRASENTGAGPKHGANRICVHTKVEPLCLVTSAEIAVARSP